MNDLHKEIVTRAKMLLQEKRVDAVLGFSHGTVAMARRPFWARTPEDAEQLCWDEFCLTNLANFIPGDSEEVVAVTAKGCDWRNLVVHQQEGRLSLSGQVMVLGIDCEGMLDPEKIRSAAGGPERVLAVRCSERHVHITVPDGEVVVERALLYRQSCLECIQRAPLSADHWLRHPQDQKQPVPAESSGARLPQERVAREHALRMVFKDCLMCFACRDICPLCYCSQCFVDREKSHWLSAQASIDRLLDFHFFRAHHIAGRCTECGACETACPMNISVRQLATSLNRDIAEKTQYIPGLDPDADAPENIFRPSYHEPAGRRR